MNKSILKKMTITAMLSAIALVLSFFSHWIFPQVQHLTYDLCDVVILIISFIVGPVYGIASSLIVSLLQAILPNGSGVYGFIMNIASTCSLIIPAAFIYKKNKTKKSAVIGLSVGVATMTLMMIALNIIITPAFIPYATFEVVMGMMPFIIAFNLVKGILNAVITFLIYKHISKIIRKFN